MIFHFVSYTLGSFNLTFSWIQTATRCKFCGHLEKLPDASNFDGTFQLKHNQNTWMAHKLLAISNFDGTKFQGGTRPIFWDETETEKLGLSKITTRPRPRNSGC